MELKKINYSSAIYFGIIALVMYLVIGLLQLLMVSRVPTLQAQFGYITPQQSLLVAPFVGGLVFYAVTLLMIAVYNLVAKRFPISWNVK